MSKAGRWLRRHRQRVVLVALAIFAALNLGLFYYISAYTTAEREAEMVAYPGEIVCMDRSTKGNFYVMTKEALYRTSWTAPRLYWTPGTPTSLKVSMESDTVAVVTDHRYLSMYWMGCERPDFTIDTGEDANATVIAFSQVGGQHGYTPRNIYLLVRNDTGDYLASFAATHWGKKLYEYRLPGRVVCHDRPDFMHYIALALEDDTIFIYEEASQAVVRNMTIPGRIVEISFCPQATYLGVLYDAEDGRRLLIHEPRLNRDIIDLEVPADARSLSFEDEGARMYLMSGEHVMRWAGSTFQPYFHEPGLRAYFMPSVADYVFTVTDDSLVQHTPGEKKPRWSCALENASQTTFMVDAGGISIVGFRSSELVLVDNLQPIEGSNQAWFVFGLLIVLQGSTLVVIAFWGVGSRFRGVGILALWSGALAGVVVAGLMPDELMIEWFGDELAYLIICGTVAGLISLFLWDQQIGLYSVAVGAFAGLFLGIVVALFAAFVLSGTGYVFPGTDELVNTTMYGMATGFKMGLVGGLVATGFELALHPRHAASA